MKHQLNLVTNQLWVAKEKMIKPKIFAKSLEEEELTKDAFVVQIRHKDKELHHIKKKWQNKCRLQMERGKGGKNNLTCKTTTYGKGVRDYQGK